MSQQQYNSDRDNQGYSTAVTFQPAQVGQPVALPPDERVWMPVPSAKVPNCPPGLEYLTQVDQLIIHELLNMVRVLTGFASSTKFEIKNSVGQNCYFAVEGARTLCLRVTLRDNCTFYLVKCLLLALERFPFFFSHYNTRMLSS